MIGFHRFRPLGVGLARHLPFLPPGIEHGIQFDAQRFKLELEAIPNYVDLGVIRDVLKHNVGRALVDETIADIVPEAGLRSQLARQLGFLCRALLAVPEMVVVISCAH